MTSQEPFFLIRNVAYQTVSIANYTNKPDIIAPLNITTYCDTKLCYRLIDLFANSTSADVNSYWGSLGFLLYPYKDT